MVVTRRAPTAPATRSNSSQAVPRASAKTRVSNLSHAPEQSSPLANGKSKDEGDIEESLAKKYRREKPKPKQGGKKRKGRKSSLADSLLRYLLLFFTIYSLSVCPSDAELKSPVCRGLSEYRRFVLEPYLLPTFHAVVSHPSIAPHVERARPYADRAIQIAAPVVQRAQVEFNTRVAPQWNKLVVPQYYRYVVPQYHNYVTPQIRRVEALVEPYRSAAEQKYEQHLGRHVRFARSTLVHYEQVAEPYTQVVLKVAETPVAVPEPTAEPETVAKPTLSSSTLAVSDATPTPGTPITEESIAPVPVETVISPVEDSESEVQDAESEPSSEPTPAAVPQPEEVVEPTEGFDALSEPVAETAEVPSSSSKPFEDPDLDAFYAELGLSDEEMPVTSFEPPAPRETPALTPEEEEELKRKQAAIVAEKRAVLLARHIKWEDELDALVKEQKKTLRKTIVNMRKVAVQELKANEDIKTSIDNLVEEAERYLKGAEAYLNNLKKETRKDDEKSGLWDRVLEKVQTKFSTRLTETEELVNGWYQSRMDLEIQEVSQAITTVKDVAETAQADIGIDYVWLDDVSYGDWQRYHDLVRRAENFAEDSMAMQNGTHPSPPANPVLSALEELESEVEDVVMGFQTRLRRIRRSGERIFGVLPPETEEDQEIEAADPEVSILPIVDDEGHPAAPEAANPGLLVGRSKEEVEQAFARAETVEAANSIADEIRPDESTSTAAAPVATSVSHVEL
ncbi:hypothetical protein OF83DRAFT_1125077 [Amylostereum chailletii]|nr:hypothetical protein OF83DRAFT_1125077 [Amylostereum chailletii]